MSEVIHAKLRGVIGAMARTGLRVFAGHAGLIREDPPSRLTRKQARGLLAPKGRERAVFVADHALYGFVLNEMRERPRE
jgi:hypothetical protein